MKTLKISLLSICFIGIFSCQQAKNSVEAPAAVIESFNGLFADVSELEWENEDSQWEADFSMNGNNYSASFDNNGVWIETEEEIEIEDVPPATKYTLDSRYSKYSIEESEKVTNQSGIAYEFELKNGDDEMELLISSDGEVLKIDVGSKEDQKED